MMKHWALCHPNSDSPPLFTFKVIKKHNDPLSRKIHEAVRINECASLNSKSEWGHYKISRLTIEKSEWERRKEVEQEEKEDIALSEVIRVIKDRVNRLPTTNRSNFYRKRPFNMSSGADDAKSPCQSQAQVSVPAKRVRSEENQPKPLIMTGEGPWNPSKSKYVGKGKKSVKSASVKSDSGVKRWLRNLGQKTSTPVKPLPEKDAPEAVENVVEGASGSNLDESVNVKLKSEAEVASNSSKCTFETSSSSVNNVLYIAEDMSRKTASDASHEATKSEKFGSTNSSTDFYLHEAIEMSKDDLRAFYLSKLQAQGASGSNGENSSISDFSPEHQRLHLRMNTCSSEGSRIVPSEINGVHDMPEMIR